MTEQFGYKHWALKYWGMGFAGVLPVPPGRKEPVPVGFTGYEGAYPDNDDIKNWIANGFNAKVDGRVQHFDSDEANIALRLPDGIVGIDVDAYGNKKGGETLEHAEELWGKLPATVRSTARIDGVSGIRLFKVPPGTQLKTVITFPELGLDGIEICQYFHRYTMVRPSLHPTGRRYLWLDPDGNTMMNLPLPGSVPPLPKTWLEALSRKQDAEITTRANVQEELAGLDYDTPEHRLPSRVMDALNRAKRGISQAAGGRHDEMCRAQGHLLRLHHEGDAGVGTALNILREHFLYEITRDGSRTEQEAESEWWRGLGNSRIHDKIASTPSGKKADEAIMGQNWELPKGVPDWAKSQQGQPYQYGPVETPVEQIVDYLDDFDRELFGEDSDYTPTAELPEHHDVEQDLDDTAFLMGWSTDKPEGPQKKWSTTWAPQNLEELLESDDFEPEQPTVGRREDGACMFYAGKTNAIIGPPESGKSWVAQYVGKQELEGGNNVLYLDFEDSARGVVGRLVNMRTGKSAIKDRFLYAAPDSALTVASEDELEQVLQQYRPTAVFVDGITVLLSLHGLKSNDNDEIARFYRKTLEPWARYGAAVIVIDHISKESAKEDSGYAIGGQMKLGALTGSQIRVVAARKFGIGQEGKLFLNVHKDRPGGVRQNSEYRNKNTYWSTVFVDARDGMDMIIRFETKEESESTNGESTLHIHMERISEYLTITDPEKKGISKTKLLAAVKGNQEDLSKALSELQLLGCVREDWNGTNGKPKNQILERAYLGPDAENDRTLGLPTPSFEG